MSLHLCVGGFFHRDLAVRGVCRYSSGCPFVSSHQSLGSGWLCFWWNKSWKNSSGLILFFPQRSAMFSSTDLCIIGTVWLLYEAYHPRERAQYCLKWLDLFLCQVLAWRVRTFRIKKGQINTPVTINWSYYCLGVDKCMQSILTTHLLDCVF